MNDLEIRQLVLKIMNKAMEKTENTKSDVFINFMAHVKGLEVRLFKNGWQKSELRTDVEADLIDETIYLTRNKEDVLEKLQDMYNLICSL